jgi:hypothetical protein
MDGLNIQFGQRRSGRTKHTGWTKKVEWYNHTGLTEKMLSYRIEATKPPGRPNMGWKVNTRVGILEVGCRCRTQKEMAQGGFQRQTLVSVTSIFKIILPKV